jgi:hypothetical protein
MWKRMCHPPERTLGDHCVFFNDNAGDTAHFCVHKECDYLPMSCPHPESIPWTAPVPSKPSESGAQNPEGWLGLHLFLQPSDLLPAPENPSDPTSLACRFTLSRSHF